MSGERNRLAVLGSPVAHSKSPALHRAAYEELGLDWSYERVEVDEAGLPAFLASLGPEWRGLSLTMPLKRAVVPLIERKTALVARLGLANTVMLGGTPMLANTDVSGIQSTLQAGGVVRPATALVLGAGATGASAVEALRRMRTHDIIVAARDPARATRMLPAGVTVVDMAQDEPVEAEVVVSTVPGGVAVPHLLPSPPGGIPLLDVAYDPWPTPLGEAWAAAGGRLLHGLDMLIEQAILQIRIFTLGSPDSTLPREIQVREAMRRAVGRSTT